MTKSEESKQSISSWIKAIMLPGARAHASHRISAVATITAAISVFRFVPNTDGITSIFRGAALVVGTAALVWLALLIFFPPSK